MFFSATYYYNAIFFKSVPKYQYHNISISG